MISKQTFESNTARSFYRYAAAGKPFLLEAHALPAGITAEQLAEAMPPPPGFAPTQFTADREEAAQPDYRFVFVFGPPRTFSGQQACRLREQGTAVPRAGADSMHAAFCQDDSVVSELRAEGVQEALANGVEAPVAQSFLARVGRQLLPPEPRDREPRCGAGMFGAGC